MPSHRLYQGTQALLGDIVIAAETVTLEAESLQIPVADHLLHLFVHGMLHLFGYDHIDDDTAETMELLALAENNAVLAKHIEESVEEKSRAEFELRLEQERLKERHQED